MRPFPVFWVGRLRLDQAVADGQQNEVGGVFGADLLEDPRPVGFHRLHADVEPFVDFLVRVALGDPNQDFLFALGEVLRLDGHRLRRRSGGAVRGGGGGFQQ